MSRILLDHNLALDLRDLLPGHDVGHAVEMGWEQIGNGELLTIAEVAGFEIVITADQNIRYQQNLSGRRLSLVVVSINHELRQLFQSNIDQFTGSKLESDLVLRWTWAMREKSKSCSTSRQGNIRRRFDTQ